MVEVPACAFLLPRGRNNVIFRKVSATSSTSNSTLSTRENFVKRIVFLGAIKQSLTKNNFW